jgi:hypothetical protein
LKIFSFPKALICKKEVLPYLRFNTLINKTLTSLNPLVMPKNTFKGAVMFCTDVSTYYQTNQNNPINPNYAVFDHFVFQQVLANPNDADNTYTLCAYAVFTPVSGRAPVLITLGPQKRTGQPYKAPAGVQFANMKLDKDDLNKLYPPLPAPPTTADITLTPKDLYQGTDYVIYQASTDGSGDTGAGGSVTLNPSPPYNG